MSSVIQGLVRKWRLSFEPARVSSDQCPRRHVSMERRNQTMTACNKDILNRLKRTEGQLRGFKNDRRRERMRRCHHAIVRRQFQC